MTAETPEQRRQRSQTAWEQRIAEDEQQKQWYAVAFNIRHLTGAEGSADWQNRLGRALAEQYRWPEAVAAYARARLLQPGESDRWYSHGLALLGAGDEAGYREFSAAMLDEFGQAKDAACADSVAWLVALRPHALDADGLNQAKALARRAVAADSKSADFQETLAALSYRTGDFAAARKHLDEATKLSGDDGLTFWQQLFLAMTHHQLGNKDEARDFLAAAVARIDADLKKPAKEQPDWGERLRRRLLRQEADELIKKGR